MGHYLITASYTSEAWAAQIENPKNRMEVVKPLFDAVGGRIESAYLSFGTNDLVLICEFPDKISAASVAIKAASGGGLSNFHTTPLISIEDGLEALNKAGNLSYSPPGD